MGHIAVDLAVRGESEKDVLLNVLFVFSLFRQKFGSTP